jgi:long-chain acyl-CoA synthetase
MERSLARAGRIERFGFSMALSLARLTPSLVFRRRLFRSVHARLGGSLGSFIVGGSPVDPALESFFEALGFNVYAGYGLTECSPVISVNGPGCRRRGSVGRPLSGVEVHIQGAFRRGDEGEILTRGPHLLQGYLDHPPGLSPCDPQGWLHTGDLGRLDAGGFLYATGRLKNLIALASGKKVQPEEVEAVLARSAAFREVCVVGARARDGLLAGTEVVCAVVVPAPREDGRAPDAAELHRKVLALAGSLAAYKRPSRVFVHPGPLPRSLSHKVQRRRVQAWIEEQEERT